MLRWCVVHPLFAFRLYCTVKRIIPIRKIRTGTTTPISEAEYAWMKHQMREVCEIWADTVLHLEVQFRHARRQARNQRAQHERTARVCTTAKVNMATAIAGAKLARRVWDDAIAARGIAFRAVCVQVE